MKQDSLSVRVLKALGHPVRYKIIKYLFEGPKCVCKLNENIEFSQSNLSQHLRILKDAGLVTCEKKGLNIHYRLSSEEVKDIIASTEKFVSDYVKDIR
ncbi:MAG: metalloregulator ArsR/SmtB family transcription factor [Thermoanaerobacteraceae bacterium]|nr:metalloregulator ArsR/SmtB family transcription factor [Thermoanaerobacteraceae bacterium]